MSRVRLLSLVGLLMLLGCRGVGTAPSCDAINTDTDPLDECPSAEGAVQAAVVPAVAEADEP